MSDVRWQPQRAAVLVIDAQNDFCHPRGLQARQGKDVARVEPALGALQGLLDAARRSDVPVFFVRNLHSPSTDTPQWLGRHGDADRLQSCQVGSWGAEFCGVVPEDGDTVIDKHRYSAFTNPALQRALRGAGRDSLIVTGFTTNVCVESTLREAVCRDFLVTLVDDCCAAYTERAHERAVESVRAGFGPVVNSDALLSAWSSTPHPTVSAAAPGVDR